MSKMTLSEELAWRGFVNQTTLDDIKLLDAKHFKLYFGVDPSADSMTVGNLAAAMMVKAFHRYGHDITLLIGGATGMIGDPSFKDSERSLLTVDQVAHNKKAIVGQYHQLFGQKIRVVDNYSWFRDMGYLEFLRDVGKHFSLTPLLQRDYITARIGPNGSGMSYAEFSYTLIQGYDFYHLNKEYGIDLQLCGSDQWGNGLSGVELIRKKTGKETHIFSTPLVVNKATGVKFGKSEDGAVWLDPARTSPFKFYQFWLNTDDESVGDYLKIFTELDKAQISKVMEEFEKNKGSRLAQKTLAQEVTRLVHGSDRAMAVQRASQSLFGEVGFLDLDKKELDLLKAEVLLIKSHTNGNLPEMLVNAGLATSNSEAMRFIESGAVSINGTKVELDKPSPLRRGSNLIKRGKNSFAIVECK